MNQTTSTSQLVKEALRKIRASIKCGDLTIDPNEITTPMFPSITPRGDGMLGLTSDPQLLLHHLTELCGRIVVGRHGKFQLSEHLKSVLSHIACWLAHPAETPPFLILSGPVGSGKSTILYAAYRILCWAYDTQKMLFNLSGETRNSEERIIAHLVSFAPAEKIPRVYNPEEFEGYTGEFLALCKSRVLVLDDLGTEPVEMKYYGTTTFPSNTLLFDRYNQMRRTIISTNLTPDHLRERYGDRVYDRLREVSDTVPLINESFRNRVIYKRKWD